MLLNHEWGNLSEMFRFFLKLYEMIKHLQWNGILNFSCVNILSLICEHFEIIQWEFFQDHLSGEFLQDHYIL